MERIKFYFRERDDIEILFSEKPLTEDKADIYIAPAEEIEAILDRRNTADNGLPIIGYGSPSYLRKAFLSGCSDYLKDEWAIDELDVRLTRIKNICEKHYSFPWGSISFRGTGAITALGIAPLSIHEYKILTRLLRQRGKTVSREVLFYTIWNKRGNTKSRVLDVHISSLRKKLTKIIPKPEADTFIKTIKNGGYMIQ
ncbi:MAG: winged helix-turn-helix domain-containing protein [Spirochaetales bacterium]|nr:winged helix-turn-helix domain-containing protein [Spirochaetales bacterium]